MQRENITYNVYSGGCGPSNIYTERTMWGSTDAIMMIHERGDPHRLLLVGVVRVLRGMDV